MNSSLKKLPIGNKKLAQNKALIGAFARVEKVSMSKSWNPKEGDSSSHSDYGDWDDGKYSDCPSG